MLRVRTEYRKGVLFVRLVGRIDNEGYLKNINQLVNDVGIKFIVLNISSLDGISLKNIYYIKKYIKVFKRKKCLLLICDENDLLVSLFKSFEKIPSEIDAFSFINRKDAYE